MRKFVPNTLTLGNLLCGFFASVYASQGMVEIASLLILGGMVFDFLDGFAARLLKAYSDTGKELDSLADMVSFGVAPALILFSLFQDDGTMHNLLIAVAALIPLASALRLARFNNDPDQKTSFRGMPTPASALVIVAIVISGVYGKAPFIGTLMHNTTFLSCIAIFLSVMMLINVRMISLKFTNLKFRGNEDRYIFLAVVFISVALLRADSLLAIMVAYILLSFSSSVVRSR